MSIRHLYPNATEPTEPRFKVGDMVHSCGHALLQCPGADMSSLATAEAYMAELEEEGEAMDPREFMVYPPVFGEIVEYQEAGTEIYYCAPLDQRGTNTWRGCEWEGEEAELDLPDSGSIWYLPDNERQYFVRLASKQPYLYGEGPTEFTPLRSASGSPSTC